MKRSCVVGDFKKHTKEAQTTPTLRHGVKTYNTYTIRAVFLCCIYI